MTTKKSRAPKEQLQETEPPVASEVLPVAESNDAQAEPKQTNFVDPRSEISVSLSDYRGGPSMHLLRSYKYKQMQIRFDGGQPDERHLAVLREAGWKDRTESEGIWTKQIPVGEWQPVLDAQRLFNEMAHEIRADKGLGPVSLAHENGRT